MMNQIRMPQDGGTSDKEFISELRRVIDRYLVAVDRWEAAYRKYYRLPRHARTGNHLEAEQREYGKCRRELQAMLPRARRLCVRHQMPDSFSGLLRISLGQYSPQERPDSAIGRNERAAVTTRLLELSGACQEWESAGRSADTVEIEPERKSLLRRLVNYFY